MSYYFSDIYPQIASISYETDFGLNRRNTVISFQFHFLLFISVTFWEKSHFSTHLRFVICRKYDNLFHIRIKFQERPFLFFNLVKQIQKKDGIFHFKLNLKFLSFKFKNKNYILEKKTLQIKKEYIIYKHFINLVNIKHLIFNNMLFTL